MTMDTKWRLSSTWLIFLIHSHTNLLHRGLQSLNLFIFRLLTHVASPWNNHFRTLEDASVRHIAVNVSSSEKSSLQTFTPGSRSAWSTDINKLAAQFSTPCFRPPHPAVERGTEPVWQVSPFGTFINTPVAWLADSPEYCTKSTQVGCHIWEHFGWSELP